MNRLTCLIGLGLLCLTRRTHSQFISSGWTDPPPFNFNPPLTCPEALVSSIGYIDNLGCTRIRQSSDGIFIPCCDLKDKCYGTCGMTKLLCEEQFRNCMFNMCPTFMIRHPEIGTPQMCPQFWGRMGGMGSQVWRISQSEDFSCEAFESAQLRSWCTIGYATPYGIAKRKAV